MVRTLETMTDMSRQGVMDAVRRLQASDIPMLLPGVTVNGSAAGSSPVTVTRLLRFADGRWSLPTES
jgi:hypothetical protein